MSWWPILCSVAIYIAFAVLVGKMIAFTKWQRVAPDEAAGQRWTENADAEPVLAAGAGDDEGWLPQHRALHNLLLPEAL